MLTHFRPRPWCGAGQPGAAAADIAKLAELRDTLRKANDTYWAEQVDIQRQVAIAWVLYAEGKHDEALRGDERGSPTRQNKAEKHVVTPGPLAPAHQALRLHAARRGLAREALVALEATRGPTAVAALRAPRGTARSAAPAKAKTNYAKLVTLRGRRSAPAGNHCRKYLAEQLILVSRSDSVSDAMKSRKAFRSRSQHARRQHRHAHVFNSDLRFDDDPALSVLEALVGFEAVEWSQTQWPPDRPVRQGVR